MVINSINHANYIPGGSADTDINGAISHFGTNSYAYNFTSFAASHGAEVDYSFPLSVGFSSGDGVLSTQSVIDRTGANPGGMIIGPAGTSGDALPNIYFWVDRTTGRLMGMRGADTVSAGASYAANLIISHSKKIEVSNG